MQQKYFTSVLIVLVLMILAGEGKSGSYSEGPTPIDLMTEIDLYKVGDLNTAASLLRKTAINWGVDPVLIPNHSYIGNSESEDSVRIRFPHVVREYPNNWFDPINFCDKENTAVVFVASRGLSVEEIASLLENGVRFLDNLITFPPKYAFLVNVSETSLKHLNSQPYFEFSCSYLPSDKIESYCSSKSDGRYTIEYFGAYYEDFRRELINCGVLVRSVVEQFNGIVVLGDRTSIDRVSQLWWVKTISCDPGASID